MGLVITNTCPNCNALYTTMNTLLECEFDKEVWERLMIGISKQTGLPLLLYALGINDNRTRL
jgi:hypothetical protein